VLLRPALLLLVVRLASKQCENLNIGILKFYIHPPRKCFLACNVDGLFLSWKNDFLTLGS